MPSSKGANPTSHNSRAVPSGSRTQDWLAARAAATPDKPFLIDATGSLSFAAAQSHVDEAAAQLLAQGDIRPSDRVGLLTRNNSSAAIAMLALLRLQATLVPLNLRLTVPELAWQLGNVGCKALVCQPETQQLATQLPLPRLLLAPLRSTRPPSDAPVCMWDYQRDCAIIHSSGTSGSPKAAALTLGNFYYSAVASGFRLGIAPDDRWLCVLPLYHVGGLSIVLRSLLYGTAVQFMDYDLARLDRALRDEPVTVISLVPTILQRLLDARDGAWNRHLRLILLGGEAAAPALIERSLAQGLPVATSYGLSEATSQVATALPAQLRAKPDIVGKPLLFNRLRIVDEQGADLPPGSRGEVLVQGSTIMRGYIGVSAARQAALRGGWLHTGDIGSIDNDGDLRIWQRRSDLIVSGGENIYPAEVEAALRQHPAVAAALVLGLPDAAWGQRVAALLVAGGAGKPPTPSELSAFLRQRLAGYKLPQQYAFCAALPRNTVGKILRGQAQAHFTDDPPTREA